MKLLFLGGADEVGASCTFLEAAGRRVLVDAGIRMQARDGDQLPHLARLEETGPLDAILVTHAHTDHIGALPLVHLARPEVPLITTPPTLSLMRILLGDALRIMEGRWEKEREIPLYPAEAVAGMLARVRTVEAGEEIPLCGGRWTATFTPSGHILGSCSIHLDTPEGAVFFTGDYSLDPQRTVEPMRVPPVRPDVVITESTYGNRMHAHRRSEERRLAETVAAVIARGGKVLIPAFALGRAQEAILILLDAQRRGEIPQFPIHVDGMVKSVCAAYAAHPEFLARSLRRLVERVGNPFFPQGECAVAVRPADRQKVLDGPPCAVIASSGMLTGGPSAFYAAALAAGPENAILITGYQDEESPGRRLLDLTEGRTRRLVLAGQEAAVNCRVERYSLSAHADSGQMAGVVGRLSPRDAILVHGDPAARAGLAAALPRSARVHLPANGEILELGTYRKAPAAPLPAGRPGGEGRPFDLEALAERLRASQRPGRVYSIRELAEAWFGPAAGDPEVEAVRDVLGHAGAAGFEPEARRPNLYRLDGAPAPTPAAKEPAAPDGRSEQNAALKVVEELFADCPELYRKGAHLEEARLVLYFRFPDAARDRFAERLEEAARRTGWTVTVWPHAHQAALVEAAAATLPPGWELRRTPSVFANDKRIRLKVRAEGSPNPAALQALSEAFRERTGHALEFELDDAAPAPVAQARASGGPMEQNQAFGRLREELGRAGLSWFRTSLKQDGSGAFLEVSFVSPLLARRLEDRLGRLEAELGWTIRVNPEPNHDLIKRRVRELVPSAWGLRKEPGFFKDEGLVRLRLQRVPDSAGWDALARAVEDETGCRLEWQTS